MFAEKERGGVATTPSPKKRGGRLLSLRSAGSEESAEEGEEEEEGREGAEEEEEEQEAKRRKKAPEVVLASGCPVYDSRGRKLFLTKIALSFLAFSCSSCDLP